MGKYTAIVGGGGGGGGLVSPLLGNCRLGVSCEADQQVRCACVQMYKLWTVEMLLIMVFV